MVAFAGGYRSVEGLQADEVSREIFKRVFGGDARRFLANHPATIAKANAQEVRNRVAIKMLVGLEDSLLENNRSMHATLTEMNLAHEYWEIPGIRHDLPRLSAWLGSDGLQFAARHFAGSGTNGAPTQAQTAEMEELAPAAECREREGLPNFFAKLTQGWRQLDPATDSLARNFGNRLPELWQASHPGESISFRFRGTTVRVYDLLGPDCGQVTIAVDDQKPALKPRFDAYCTYHRLATLSVGEGLEDTAHTVKITIHPEQPDKARILNQRGEKIDDPKRFDGTAWYAGALLMIGDLVD